MVEFVVALLIILVQFVLIPRSQVAYAATSPTLGNADSFVILAGAALTDGNPANTHITGNVGTTGGGATNTLACTSMVSGTMYAVDAGGPACAIQNATLLGNANTDLVAAYNALSGGSNAPAGCTTIPNELGGQTLVPGLYCTAGNMTLNGTLTLSGTTGVWVFQSPSTLTTVGAAAKVVGGDPCNVWWQLPDATTGGIIGSGSTMVGNIVALGAITFADGATLNGRALSRTKAITLIGNTITKAVCSTTTTTSSSSNSSSGGSTSAPAAKVCPVLSCVTPTILEFRRVSPTSIFLSWGPYAGLKTFVVQYGLTNGNWLYNTTVTGFSTTLNALPSNQPIWVLISPTDSCSIGPCGRAQLVGGPALPNTGFAPHQNIISWTPTGIFALSSFLLKLIYR